MQTRTVRDVVREYTRGWRRKAGLVCLMLAMALGVAWSRSYRTSDLIFVGPVSLLSQQGSLSCGIFPTRWRTANWHQTDATTLKIPLVHYGSQVPHWCAILILMLAGFCLIFWKQPDNGKIPPAE